VKSGPDMWFQKVTEGILATDDSKVWINFWTIEAQGWDFGIPGSPPVQVQLSDRPSDRLYLSDTKLWETSLSRMKDITTGKVVFQLPDRFGKPLHIRQWGGQYLVACFRLGEVLIIDFSHVLL